MPAIEVQELRKSYGTFEALRGISFSVEPGEVVGFLGPNGAGKTTAIRILTGFFAPTGGTARIDGKDVLTSPIEARRRIGYLPESSPLYAEMRVGDYLEYVGRIRGLGTAERTRAIARTAEWCGITDRLDQPVHELSKGYRQRAGLAQALLHEPEILILDEPTSGLDPNQIVEIRNLIRDIGRRRTVLLSTHILSEVQATCDRVIIIHKGELVADGRTDEVTAGDQGGQFIRATYTAGKVVLRRAAVDDAIRAIPEVERLISIEAEEPDHHAYEILARADIRPALFQVAVDQGITLLELGRVQSNLEEVFRRLTDA